MARNSAYPHASQNIAPPRIKRAQCARQVVLSGEDAELLMIIIRKQYLANTEGSKYSGARNGCERFCRVTTRGCQRSLSKALRTSTLSCTATSASIWDSFHQALARTLRHSLSVVPNRDHIRFFLCQNLWAPVGRDDKPFLSVELCDHICGRLRHDLACS